MLHSYYGMIARVVVSVGNEYTQLRSAFDYWDALEVGNVLKDAAHLVTLDMLTLYNDSCTDGDDVLEECELAWLFGE